MAMDDDDDDDVDDGFSTSNAIAWYYRRSKTYIYIV